MREYGREMHCEPSQINKSAYIAASNHKSTGIYIQGYDFKDVMMRAGGCMTNTMQHGDVGEVANDSNCNGGQMAKLAGLPTGNSG